MVLPPALHHTLQALLATPIQVTPISGGDINQAARLQTASDTFFLKWHPQPPSGMFAAEARGLALLASTHSLRIPQVIAHGEAFLLLEWLPPTPAQNPDLLAERLGEGLAALHQQTQPQHGLDHDNFIGSLPQPNQQTVSWVEFYRDHRIGFQHKWSAQQGELTPARDRLLKTLCEKMPALLPNAPPSLLHGDLWGGNYMGISGDIPVIYDPAVYYGHREVEVAFTELFGGFAPRFYAAYHAVYPLEAGYSERKALYQLYPLLVHMNLFGGHYGARVSKLHGIMWGRGAALLRPYSYLA